MRNFLVFIEAQIILFNIAQQFKVRKVSLRKNESETKSETFWYFQIKFLEPKVDKIAKFILKRENPFVVFKCR